MLVYVTRNVSQATMVLALFAIIKMRHHMVGELVAPCISTVLLARLMMLDYVTQPVGLDIMGLVRFVGVMLLRDTKYAAWDLQENPMVAKLALLL
jgi:hypothetical protein